MSFAALEARVTASVFKRLANAQATFGSADPVAVVFDAAQGYVNELGLQTLQPTLMVQPSAAPSVAEGDEITIDMPELQVNAGAYLVRQVVPLAEGGMLRLVLARAA